MGKFFNKKLRKSCAFCTHGIKSQFNNEIFCKKKGIVTSDSVCRKYEYDVLKRTPDNNVICNNYSAEDFKL